MWCSDRVNMPDVFSSVAMGARDTARTHINVAGETPVRVAGQSLHAHGLVAIRGEREGEGCRAARLPASPALHRPDRSSLCPCPSDWPIMGQPLTEAKDLRWFDMMYWMWKNGIDGHT